MEFIYVQIGMAVMTALVLSLLVFANADPAALSGRPVVELVYGVSLIVFPGTIMTLGLLGILP